MMKQVTFSVASFICPWFIGYVVHRLVIIINQVLRIIKIAVKTESKMGVYKS